MEIMTILGSPRKHGNTARVLQWTEEELRQAGHSVQRADISDYSVAGCCECFNCRKYTGEPACGQDDEGVVLLNHMIRADAVVLASPVFCWGFSAQLKALLDRTYCLGKEDGTRLMEGTATALIATAADDYERNIEFLVESYRQFAEYHRCRDAGHLAAGGCTTPDAINADIHEKARDLARAIGEMDPVSTS